MILEVNEVKDYLKTKEKKKNEQLEIINREKEFLNKFIRFQNTPEFKTIEPFSDYSIFQPIPLIYNPIDLNFLEEKVKDLYTIIHDKDIKGFDIYYDGTRPLLTEFIILLPKKNAKEAYTITIFRSTSEELRYENLRTGIFFEKAREVFIDKFHEDYDDYSYNHNFCASELKALSCPTEFFNNLIEKEFLQMPVTVSYEDKEIENDFISVYDCTTFNQNLVNEISHHIADKPVGEVYYHIIPLIDNIAIELKGKNILKSLNCRVKLNHRTIGYLPRKVKVTQIQINYYYSKDIDESYEFIILPNPFEEKGLLSEFLS